MRTSIRKQITNALGNAGLRDWKSPEEMNQAKALYDVMVGNDASEDQDVPRGNRVRVRKPKDEPVSERKYSVPAPSLAEESIPGGV